MFMNCTRTFGFIMGQNEDEYVIWELIMSYALVMSFTEEISSLMNLLASIMFNDSCGVPNYLYWA